MTLVTRSLRLLLLLRWWLLGRLWEQEWWSKVTEGKVSLLSHRIVHEV